MWVYEKKLQFPVSVRRPNAALARLIISQVGGPDGELSASMRYLNQRYAMPYREGMATLTDIGTEELAHLEMVSAIIHQLTRGLNAEQLRAQGFAPYYVDHTTGLWPQSAGGEAFSTTMFQSKGDPITDLNEDLAAEQKARTTYDNILRLLDDPDVIAPIRFLRQRELVHYQRFGETLRIVQDKLNERNFYAFNPAFDIQPGDACPRPPAVEEADGAAGEAVRYDGNTGRPLESPTACEAYERLDPDDALSEPADDILTQ